MVWNNSFLFLFDSCLFLFASCFVCVSLCEHVSFFFRVASFRSWTWTVFCRSIAQLAQSKSRQGPFGGKVSLLLELSVMVLSLIQIYCYTVFLYQNDHSTGYECLNMFKRLYVYDSVCLFYFAYILGLRKLTYLLEYSMLPKEHAFVNGIPFWEVRVCLMLLAM